MARLGECDRHHLPREILKRCSHFGNRFVIEIRHTEDIGSFIDYVEDLPISISGSPLDDVVVEAHYVHDDAIESLWNSLIERMLSNDQPNPDLGT